MFSRWVFAIVGLAMLSESSMGAIVEIDLDRSEPGVQTFLELGQDREEQVFGSVVVTGDPRETVGRFGFEIRFRDSCFYDPTFLCESFEWRIGDSSETPSLGMASLCREDRFRFADLVESELEIGEDGVFTLIDFDLAIQSVEPETVEVSFTDGPLFGIVLNGEMRSFRRAAPGKSFIRFGPDACVPLPTWTPTPSLTPTPSNTFTPSNTPTETFTPTHTPTPTFTSTPTFTFTPLPTFTPAPPCGDTGFYVLDSYGGRHRVGDPIVIPGPLYYGRPVAQDLEKVGTLSESFDLSVLDRLGAVQFVGDPSGAPPQMFYWPEGSTPPCGFAVDLAMTRDMEGFWVLTEGGGIFRAGSALPSGEDPLLGNDAAELCEVLPVPLGPAHFRHPDLVPDPHATLRAVGFVVIQSEDPSAPHGYIVLDSQGGHHTFDAEGRTLDDDILDSLLNSAGGSSETVYPFFQGADIARDLELHPAGDRMSGLIILDGWGGVHPVPVSFVPTNQVSFIRNEAPARTTTVGLPYFVHAYDDPATEEDESDESLHGLDAHSIFLDLEFCTSGDGVYILDRYGGVFTFGNTRLDPEDTLTHFGGGPYFFPSLLAQDLEALDLANETPM